MLGGCSLRGPIHLGDVLLGWHRHGVHHLIMNVRHHGVIGTH
jgi:hypothetical protein